MQKILFAALPFLMACNMATDSNEPAGKKAATDTAAQLPDPVVNKTPAAAPRLQPVQWNGVREMTDETFKSDVLASSAITLVDFNATWCGPCKQQQPILEKLVKEYKGRLNFASVDVDACPATAAYYRISSIPTLAFYQDAQQGTALVGLTSYEELKAAIETQLSGAAKQQ